MIDARLIDSLARLWAMRGVRGREAPLALSEDCLGAKGKMRELYSPGRLINWILVNGKFFLRDCLIRDDNCVYRGEGVTGRPVSEE